MLRLQKGFTLAELLIVIVILGILGGIALPRFYPQQEKARVAEAVAMLSAIRQGEMSYHLETGAYLAVASDDTSAASVTNWGKIGIDRPESTQFTYTVDSSDGAASAERVGGDEKYNGKTIILNIDGTWGSGSHPFTPENPA